jgi:glycosyltransferase involved in cell wall biosynthesis
MRADYPQKQSFDVHLRNTWPPTTHDMVGRLNAYVCFAWEESEFPVRIVDSFNRDLHLIMVTSTFVERAFRHSGVMIPITVVGNGCDHVKNVKPSLTQIPPLSGQRRITHISSGLPRKGVDLLIEAYIAAFRCEDPVELLIKTFPNPDNIIELTLARLEEKSRDAAPIKVECASWTNEELIGLYQSSAMVVAPSRGEGFGLPLAEAMMLEVPVVTTGHGGQADFCNDKTAWIVGHTLSPSRSHVAGSFGLWANANVDDLAAKMRAVINQPELARQRSKTAKRFLETHFTWQRVAARVIRSISTAMRAPALREKGRRWTIDLVSSWQQQCGIATYAGHLFSTSALGSNVSRVLAKRDLDDGLPTGITASPLHRFSRIWGYDIQALTRLAEQLEASAADVIWIQHHPGHFSNSDMDIIAEVLKKSRYKVRVITLHNVMEALKGNSIKWASAFDLIFVHSAEDAASLSGLGFQQVAVIPHGFVPSNVSQPSKSDKFTIGSFGFLTPHKNIDKLILAVKHARRYCPQIHLKLFNAERSSDDSRHLRAIIETLIDNLGLREFVSARFDFVPEHELIDELGTCDLLVFPYGESNESATGAARIAMSVNRPILCSRSAPLRDLWPISHVLKTGTIECITEALISLVQSEALLKVFDPDRQKMTQSYSYTKLADRYINHIDRLLLENAKLDSAA